MNKQEEPKEGNSNRAMITKRKDVNTGLDTLNFLDEKELASAEIFLKKLMASEKGGIKSVAEGLAILVRTRDLQLPFSSGIEHIHIINGKTGVDIHIIKTLLLRAGVVWNCTKNYAPQYQYTDGNTVYNETQLPDYCVKCRNAEEAAANTVNDSVGVYPIKWYTDLKGNIYSENQISSKCVVAINKAHALKLAQDGKFPIIRIPAQPIDYVTEYEFTRYMMVNGREIIRTCKSSFSYSEAQAAELFSKDTYLKYPKVLIAHRAFTYGARDIASDVLMGCYEIKELKAIAGMDITDNDFIEDVNAVDID